VPDAVDHSAAKPRLGLLLTSSSLAGSFGYISGVALNPFLDAIARDLGTTVPVMGQIPAISLGLAAVLGVVAGPFADRFGHRRLLLAGFLSLVVNMALTAVAGTYAVLVAATAIGSISQAILSPIALAIVGERFPLDQRRRALGIVIAASSATQIVGLPLLTTIAGFQGWRVAMAAVAGVALLVTAIEARAIPADPPIKRKALVLSATLTDYLPLLRYRPTLGIIAASGIRGIGASFIFVYLGAFLIERHGLAIQDVGWAYTATGLGFLVGSIAIAGYRGRIALRIQQAGSLALTGIAFGAPLIIPTGPIPAILSISAGFGFIAVVNSTSTAELAVDSPAGQATTMTGNTAANGAGWAIGGSLGGLLVALGGYTALGWSIVAVCLIAAWVSWATRPLQTRGESASR
jgi:predicted MFS family arabinose efflux permease